MTIRPKRPSARPSSRDRQPMPRGQVVALLQRNNAILVGALNELEGRLLAAERRIGLADAARTESGLVLPASLTADRAH